MIEALRAQVVAKPFEVAFGFSTLQHLLIDNPGYPEWNALPGQLQKSGDRRIIPLAQEINPCRSIEMLLDFSAKVLVIVVSADLHICRAARAHRAGGDSR